MRTPDPSGEEHLGWGADLALSLGAAVWLTVTDALGLRSALGQSFDETFLRAYSPWGLSPAAYVLIILLGMAIVAGAGIALLQARLIRVPDRPRLIISGLLAGGALSAALGILRTETFNEFATMGRYLAILAAGAALFALLLLALSRPRRPDAGSPRSGRMAGILGAAAVLLILAAPRLQLSVLPNHPVPAGRARLPNVLIVMLDTVRADALSCLDPVRGQSPNLDALAGEGILFRKAVSPAPWTVPSHGSLFTGLFPSQHGASWDRPALDESLRTLAEALYAKGYRTVGFSENPSVSRVMGYGQGFGEFSDMYLNLRRAMGPGLIGGVRSRLFGRPPTLEYAADTTAQFLRWLRGNTLGRSDPPFFAFLNYMAGHLPDYARPGLNKTVPPPDVAARVNRVSALGSRNYLPRYALSPSEMDVLRMFYRGDVAYLDSRLGLLFDFLRDHRLLDGTIVVVVADHGENFGDHGLIEHSFNLYNSVLHVPLIIRFPSRIGAGLVRNDTVSTVHLMDTILDLVGGGKPGADGPDPGRESRSLLDPSPEPAVYAEVENLERMLRLQLAAEPSASGLDPSRFDRSLECVFEGDRKLIRSSDGRLELYDTVNDWAETRDLSSAEPARVEALAARLSAWRRGLAKPRLDQPQRSPDRALREALKSLGYVH